MPELAWHVALTFTIVHLLQQNDILQVFSALDSSDTTDAHESVEEFRRDKMIEFHDFVSRTLSSVQKENKFEIKCVYSKDVKHCLLEHVVKEDFGMVVVGAKGKSLAKGFVMGSTVNSRVYL